MSMNVLRHVGLLGMVCVFVGTDLHATNQESDVLHIGSNCYIHVWGFKLPKQSTEQLFEYRKAQSVQVFNSGNWDNYFAILRLDGFDLYVDNLGDGCFRDYYLSIWNNEQSSQTNSPGMKFGADFQKMPVRATWFSGIISTFCCNAPVSDNSYAHTLHFSKGVLDYMNLGLSDNTTRTVKGVDLEKFVRASFVYYENCTDTNLLRSNLVFSTCVQPQKSQNNMKRSAFESELMLDNVP